MKAIEQKWFDENRERFGANTSSAEVNFPRCQHLKTVRKTANSFECETCHAGWIFRGEIPDKFKNLTSQ